MQEFYNAYEELFAAYVASGGHDQAYARMVGALKVIIPFNVDERSLAEVVKNLQDSAKRETMEILKKETA